MDAVAYSHADTQKKRINNLYHEGESAPSYIELGQEWYVPSSNKVYKRVNDGTSDVWIDISTAGATAAISKSEDFLVGTPSGDYDGVSVNTFPTVKGYTPGYVIVVRENMVLGPTEFTSTDGINIVLASDASAADVIQVIAFGNFNVANHYDKSEVYTQSEIDTKLQTDVPAGAVFTDTVTPLVDTLVSTSTTSALTANQGKILKDVQDTKVGSVQEGGVGTLLTNALKVTQVEYDGLTPNTTTWYAIVG